MKRTWVGFWGVACVVALAGVGSACGSTSESPAPSGGSGGSAGTGGAAGTGGTGGSDGSVTATCDQIKAWAEAYKAAHPGNGGKDWDVNAKTDAQLASDPEAQRLASVCGPGQRPVIPIIAWEYGGSDHPWTNPEQSALIYCVYIPVSPSTDNWKYDAGTDHVTADVYVKCPDQNPCKDRQGADQVAGCMGDPTNFEILVDTASLRDGADAGLSLANSSTELILILPNGTKVHLYNG